MKVDQLVAALSTLKLEDIVSPPRDVRQVLKEQAVSYEMLKWGGCRLRDLVASSGANCSLS